MKHDRLVKEIEKLGLNVEKSTWHDSHYYAIGPVEKGMT